MYFDTNNFIDNSDTFQFNYYPTTFYKNQFQDTITKSGFIEIPYSSRSNQPNVAVFGAGYITNTLFITKPVHMIDGIDYDAELIVKHRSLTNFSNPLYTCFLLKTDKSAQTDIDKLIEGGNDTVLNLNQYITPQKTILYKNNLLESSLVAIMTVPILVNTTFENLKPGLISLSPYVNEYSILYSEPIVHAKYIEGFGESEDSAPVTVAGYCQPIDEDDPNISETAAKIIPIDSKSVITESANTSIKTMMNFFGFFILIIISFFVSPIAHRILIVELINDNETFTRQRKLNRASAADVYAGTVFFGMALAFINYGILNNSPISTVIGFYVFIFFLASVIVLQYSRLIDTDNYFSQFQPPTKQPDGSAFDASNDPDPVLGKVEMDWGFFSDNLFNLFFVKTGSKKDADGVEIPTYSFQLAFLGVAGIFTGLYFLIKKIFKFTGKTGAFFLTSIYFYAVLFSIYLMALFNHYLFKSKQQSGPS